MHVTLNARKHFPQFSPSSSPVCFLSSGFSEILIKAEVLGTDFEKCAGPVTCVYVTNGLGSHTVAHETMWDFDVSLLMLLIDRAAAEAPRNLIPFEVQSGFLASVSSYSCWVSRERALCRQNSIEEFGCKCFFIFSFAVFCSLVSCEV